MKLLYATFLISILFGPIFASHIECPSDWYQTPDHGGPKRLYVSGAQAFIKRLEELAHLLNRRVTGEPMCKPYSDGGLSVYCPIHPTYYSNRQHAFTDGFCPERIQNLQSKVIALQHYALNNHIYDDGKQLSIETLKFLKRRVDDLPRIELPKTPTYRDHYHMSHYKDELSALLENIFERRVSYYGHFPEKTQAVESALNKLKGELKVSRDYLEESITIPTTIDHLMIRRVRDAELLTLSLSSLILLQLKSLQSERNSRAQQETIRLTCFIAAACLPELPIYKLGETGLVSDHTDHYKKDVETALENRLNHSML
jgi:hypothetical protein